VFLTLPIYEGARTRGQSRADLGAERQLAAVHLMDAHHISDAGKYVALLLLSLRTMLQMELPHVNVLSKIDLLSNAGELRECSSSSVEDCETRS
jgi:hypothetical protein